MKQLGGGGRHHRQDTIATTKGRSRTCAKAAAQLGEIAPQLPDQFPEGTGVGGSAIRRPCSPSGNSPATSTPWWWRRWRNMQCARRRSPRRRSENELRAAFAPRRAELRCLPRGLPAAGLIPMTGSSRLWWRAAGLGLAAAPLATAFVIVATAPASAQEAAGQGAGEVAAAPGLPTIPVARGRICLRCGGLRRLPHGGTRPGPSPWPEAGRWRRPSAPFFWAEHHQPDPDHGIGDWSEEDFRRALVEGRSPEGHAYFPRLPVHVLYGDDRRGHRGISWAYPADG